LKLAVDVADISPSKKDLMIEVDAAEVKAEFDKAYENLARKVNLPGFRPGHVPRGVVKQRFAKEVKDDVLERLMMHALKHAIVDRRLNIIGQPQIDEITFDEGAPLKFKVSIEVVPDFELKPYKGLKAKKLVARITEEDIDAALERWRENAAEFVPIEDRPSQDGDHVSVNLTGKFVEEPGDPNTTEETEKEETPKDIKQDTKQDINEDIKTDDAQIKLGAEDVQPEFNENLRGVRAGDTRQFRVNYPADFRTKRLAGKSIDFTAEVVAVRKLEMPELDDDFAQEYGERETLQQLREDIRGDLQKTAEAQAEMRLQNELLAQATSGYDFEVPDSLIEEQAIHLAHQLSYDLTRHGYSPESIRAINWEEQMKGLRAQAVIDMRTYFVLARIAQAEGIKTTNAEVDQEIVRMAQERGERFEQLKARLTKEDSLSSIESRLINQKALGVITESAEVTLTELSEEPDIEKQTEKQTEEQEAV
jgi:trigger factor